MGTFSHTSRTTSLGTRIVFVVSFNCQFVKYHYNVFAVHDVRPSYCTPPSGRCYLTGHICC